MIRDEDELEGALLLPVATQVGGTGATNMGIPLAVAATPIGCFDYDDVLVEEERCQQQQEQQAFYIPTELSPSDHEMHERVGVARGQQMARIKNEEEREAIRQAQRKVYSQDFYAQLEAKNANVRARQTDREDRHALRYAHLRPSHHNNSHGDYEYDSELQLINGDSSRVIAAGKTMDATSKERQTKGAKNEDKTSGYKVGGYHVKEYQFDSSSYDTQEYGISEYKSVYD
jgi:hypothetical protein